MLYIVCYDIENDRNRKKVSQILQGYGQRVQRSVFECELSEQAKGRLLRELERQIPLSSRDSIRLYPLCQTCRQQALSAGWQQVPLIERTYIYL